MRAAFYSIAFGLLATATTAADGPAVHDAWIRATPPNAETAAAYATIHGGGADDRLLGVRTAVAETVEVHTHVQHHGVMEMSEVSALPVPAGGIVTLAPGGEHLMLVGLKHPLKPGESIVLTLIFEHAGEVEIAFPVVDVRQ